MSKLKYDSTHLVWCNHPPATEDQYCQRFANYIDECRQHMPMNFDRAGCDGCEHYAPKPRRPRNFVPLPRTF